MRLRRIDHTAMLTHVLVASLSSHFVRKVAAVCKLAIRAGLCGKRPPRQHEQYTRKGHGTVGRLRREPPLARLRGSWASARGRTGALGAGA
eukprot:1590535-Pleurochrysis_carterae.AAC.2